MARALPCQGRGRGFESRFPLQVHFVYILQSLTTGRYYIGSTNDVDRRLSEHNRGQTKSTKFQRPYTLVHEEQFSSKSAAHHREIEIKRMKSGVKFKALLTSGE